jgi:hypothetical protein
MGPQFLHSEVYGREGAHRKNSPMRKCSMFDVGDEIIRAPHACSHIASPQPPIVLFGDHPSAVFAMAAERAEFAVNKVNNKADRKLRRDAPVVMAGVASWPQNRAVVESDPSELERYRLWRDDTVAWLKAYWGNCLACVVEHVDETFPHIHFVIVPPLEADRRMRISSVHPGHRAEREAAENGASKRDQKRAHRQAMRRLQDDYFTNVGMRHGLARIGPRRQRLTRAEWNERKREAAALADAHKKVDQLALEVEAAAQRRIAEEAAKSDDHAKQTIAEFVEKARRRVDAIKQKAVGHVTAFERDVQIKLQQQEATIASQADEIRSQADEIRSLTGLLREFGIAAKPTI